MEQYAIIEILIFHVLSKKIIKTTVNLLTKYKVLCI
jgi:hypothetical protein